MTALLLAVLASSLLGSLHCVGMCGGLVSLVAARPAPACGPARWGLGALDQGLYHLARGAAYGLLGLVAGALGAGVDRLGAFADLQRAAAWAAGLVMLAGGVHGLLAWRGLAPPLPSPGGAGAARLFALVGRAGPRGRALLIGALTALLPCGWLWVFLATAAGTGSAPGGLLVLLAFWAGTLPALVGLGLGLAAAAGRLRRHLPWVRGAVLVAVGLLTLSGRATLRPAPAAAPATVEQVEAAPAKPLPCCHHEP